MYFIRSRIARRPGAIYRIEVLVPVSDLADRDAVTRDVLELVPLDTETSLGTRYPLSGPACREIYFEANGEAEARAWIEKIQGWVTRVDRAGVLVWCNLES